MKQSQCYRYISPVMALAGGLTLALQTALMSLRDSAFLLPSGHFFHIAALVICLAAIVLALKATRSGKIQSLPASVGTAGSLAAGVCLIPLGIFLFREAMDVLGSVDAALALLTGPCLIFMGLRQKAGKESHLLLSCLVCVFFAAHLVGQYRIWSGMSQTPAYIFPMLACIFLTLTAYYRAAAKIAMAKTGVLHFCGLMAGFFSIAAMTDTQNLLYFLAGAIWALTDLPTPKEAQDVSA